MNYRNVSLLLGFSVWLVATLIFRFWGHYFFFIDNNLLIASFFIATIPVLYGLIKAVFNRYKQEGINQLESAVLMALPGMLCDVFCVKYHFVVFPKLSMEQSITLASWVIWAYLIVLVFGLFLKGNPVNYLGSSHVLDEVEK